jgi:hypothetical protein
MEHHETIYMDNAIVNEFVADIGFYGIWFAGDA